MKRIVFASGNKGKLKEVREILSDYEIVSAKEMGYTGEPEENGKTLYENALIKAKTISEALNLPALADDSGIFVDVLGGEPGIYSARYAGDGDSNYNNEKLLKNLEKYKNKEERKAQFKCCMVFYQPGGTIITTSGETLGYILDERVGANGFGYDPIFYSLELDKPLGLATDEEKNSVSHRGKALRKMKEYL